MKLNVTLGKKVKSAKKTYTFKEIGKRRGVYQCITESDKDVFFISFAPCVDSTAVLYINTDCQPYDIEPASKGAWEDDKFIEVDQAFTFSIN